MSHHCSQVAAAKDHTVVLTEEGYVYTFGLNTFHQLGLAPPPASAHVPKQVRSSNGETGEEGEMTFYTTWDERWGHFCPMQLSSCDFLLVDVLVN